jgi:hypothetical protein
MDTITDTKMNTDTTQDFVLADCYRSGYEHSKLGREQWIQGTLSMCEALYRARQRRPSNKEFNEWLEMNKLTSFHNHQDRAALIQMGEHYALTLQVLDKTERWSYQLIWEEEVKPRLTNASKTGPVGVPPPTEQKAQENPANTAEPVSQNGQNPQPRKVKTNDSLAKFPRSDEVRNLFENFHGRAALRKAVECYGGKEIWQLILDSIDNGLLRVQKGQENEGFSARMLFTDCPGRTELSRLELTNRVHRKRVRDEIMPAAIANKEAIIAEPHRIAEILQAHKNRLAKERLESLEKKHLEKAVSAMEPGQEEVIVYGKHYWPPAYDYNYDQIRCACWHFVGMQAYMLGGAHPKSVESSAIAIRHAMKWIREYVAYRGDTDSIGQQNVKKIFDLVQAITQAWEANPEAPCKWPALVHREGKW